MVGLGMDGEFAHILFSDDMCVILPTGWGLG